MDQKQKEEILIKAQEWFSSSIAKNHVKNSLKLIKSEAFNINPFLVKYLANYLTGNSDAVSIAKALVYPRVLGTSINTTFGNHIQRFTNDVLTSLGSTTSGIDIEYMDELDHEKKYCQLKAGPNTINKDDVDTINNHFNSIKQLSITNNLRLHNQQFVVGIIYGQEHELSGHYKALRDKLHYPVVVGQDFWHRLTGDSDFYFDLIRSINEVAVDANFTEQLNEVIEQLAQTPEIQSLARVL